MVLNSFKLVLQVKQQQIERTSNTSESAANAVVDVTPNHSDSKDKTALNGSDSDSKDGVASNETASNGSASKQNGSQNKKSRKERQRQKAKSK